MLGPGALLAMLTLIGILLQESRRELRIDMQGLVPVLKRAFGFWLTTLIAAVALYIDYPLLSQFVSPQEILTYNIPTRFFDMTKVFYNALLFAPLADLDGAVSQEALR